MRVIVFQHVEAETSGSFARFLMAGGAELTVVHLWRGEAIPPLEAFGAMLVLGGPMDVWDVALHPWLVEEKRAIRRFVREMERPYLGLCLGHQLLADALGGTCGPQKPKQVGPFSIELTAEGRASPLFEGVAPLFNAYKWHGVRVAQMPDGASRLARSAECTCEAMQAAPRAFGLQFHPEFEAATLDDWNRIEGTPAAFVTHFGPTGIVAARASSEQLLADYDKTAGKLVRNFMRIAA
jgi:GMP synthase-like glutamine amidotransferase